MLRVAKYIVFSFFIMMLCLPLLQQNSELFQNVPIVGDFQVPNEPQCNMNTIWSGNFQEQFNEFFKYPKQ